MAIDPSVTNYRIYPAIGVARVGNSTDPNGYFFGPEAPGPHPQDDNDFRDATGCIKRQAARFRIYGFNDDGEAVQEITADDAQIDWSVQVANTKSAWFNFDLAMDIPAAATKTSDRRNEKIVDRGILEIKPAPITITGSDTNSDGSNNAYAFDDGTYGEAGASVYLGELRTDANGRLIFLGGRGLSENPWNEAATTFANNDGFHDDVSDGWVEATVTVGNTTHDVTGAWVITGPPNYAPGIQGIVTGYDLLLDLFYNEFPALQPAQLSFSEHIWPILQRLPNHQWVNAGFARDFGLGSPNDWSSNANRRRLSNNTDRPRFFALRNAVFNLFRNPNADYPLSNAVPGYYGDDMASEPPESGAADPLVWMSITKTQYQWLEQWAAGNFVDDHENLRVPPTPFDDLSAAQQVQVIDRAVLDETLGGPFHPGAEYTWPMRQRSMFSDSEPFRIKRRSGAEPDFGTTLTQASALADDGPLDGCVPGSITRWMAVPWQTDTSSCLSAYEPFIDDYLPTFWPARVPNDVLTEEQAQALTDGDPTLEDLADALSYLKRPKWLRGIRYDEPIAFPQSTNTKDVGVNRFIEKWDEVGIVTQVWTAGGRPMDVWRETGRTLVIEPSGESQPIQAEHPRLRFGKR